ncbi:hypothetical protein MD484_g7083, partial [Candolleomyces efflorescens]
MRAFCDQLKPEAIEEVGCAVCAQLKLKKDMTPLAEYEEYLHVLENPDVTRVLRESPADPPSGQVGPVTIPGLTGVCQLCAEALVKGHRPKLSLANGLWVGDVPDVLKELTLAEQTLISRVRHNRCVVRVASGHAKMSANVIAFEHPTMKIYERLPIRREDLDEVLAVIYTGVAAPTTDDLKRTPVLVRRNKVKDALEWLKLNNACYADLAIDYEVLASYPLNDVPVEVLHQKSEDSGNVEPAATSQFDNDDEQGTESGPCPFTRKAAALQHLKNGGSMLAVGHSGDPQSMYNNPNLYPAMFPWLFPHGMGGVGQETHADFAKTVDDIVFRSNIHKCFGRKDNAPSRDEKKKLPPPPKQHATGKGCVNKDGMCTARFPRDTYDKTSVDPVSGHVDLKKGEPWINDITPLIAALFKCNTDTTCLLSGTAVKATLGYITDYITKGWLKTHQIFSIMHDTFTRNPRSGPESDEKPGNPDHYTSHEFRVFYWKNYVNFVETEWQRYMNVVDPSQLPTQVTPAVANSCDVGITRSNKVNKEITDMVEGHERETLLVQRSNQKYVDETWEVAFDKYNFTERQKELMSNFNLRYECYDARDDYPSLFKSASKVPIGESDDENDDLVDCDKYEDEMGDDDDWLELKDGPKTMEMQSVKDTSTRALKSAGWKVSRNALAVNDFGLPKITIDRNFNSSAWKSIIKGEKNKIWQAKFKAAEVAYESGGAPGPLRNDAYVVPASYLTKEFVPQKPEWATIINDIATRFSLNKEQRKAFDIVANHATCVAPPQLLMHLGGMGGTGKSQVIRSLEAYFKARGEPYRLVLLGPTGTSAALIGGSTYHSFLGLRTSASSGESPSSFDEVLERLIQCGYIFLDESSMLACRDLCRISARICEVLNIYEQPFGGLNVILAGDFAQLPPPKGISLYRRAVTLKQTPRQTPGEQETIIDR